MDDKQSKRKNNMSHKTIFQSTVYGPIHTGSGDIEAEGISYSQTASRLEEFYVVLSHLKAEIKALNTGGLVDQDLSDNLTAEAVAIEREAQQKVPDKAKMLMHLKTIKDYIVTGAAISTATLAGVEAVTKITPYVERLLELARQLF